MGGRVARLEVVMSPLRQLEYDQVDYPGFDTCPK